MVTSKVNVGLVQELACNELMEILDKCDGTKVRKENLIQQFLINSLFS